jgi:hypothetical protein
LCHNDLDPLKTWYEYINWIESQYDEKDESSGLKDVIERCVAKSFNENLYANDKRFLEIFLKYTKQICDPLEVFKLMFKEGRFVRLADFYINWSWMCEDVSDYKEAERILQLALENQAQPEKLITIAKQKLMDKLEIATINFENDTVEVAGVDVTGASIKRLPLQNQVKSEPNKLLIEKNDSCNQGPSKGGSNDAKPAESIEPIESKAFQIHMDAPETIDPPVDMAPRMKANKLAPRTVVTQSEPEVQPAPPVKKPPPKLVIMEQLGPNQRFFADLNRVYASETEFSFEEIRYRKLMASKKRESEKQANQQLCSEINDLRQALDSKQENDKQNLNLLKELETLKKQINDLIKRQNVSIAEKRARDENDGPPLQLECGDKRVKIGSPAKSVISGGKFGLRERKNVNEKELTLVQELWNGSIANYSEVSDDTKPMKFGRPNKDFSIFKDPTQVNALNFTTQDAFTIALPQDASEFRAKFASTPAPSKFR